jgi:hypothetical protein
MVGLLAILLQASNPCVFSQPLTDGAVQDCPVILLERSGGLGEESKSGVIAAVWASGKVVRAKSLTRPWGKHIAGHLAPDVLAGLMRAVKEVTWTDPTGEVAVDMTDDVLTLRRDGERRSWAETPGVTKTPVVTEFRKRLAALRVEQPTSVTLPIDAFRACVP